MTDNAELVLGVDGGGTKSVAWLAGIEHHREAILGRGIAGAGNPRAIGFAQAQANIDAAIDGAFAAAQLPRSTVAAACLALAGVGRTAEQQSMLAWTRERRIAQTVRVTTDAEPILAAGTPENWGIALICGTGSLVWGRAPAGITARAGGWGYLLGDDGSAYWLSLAGLQAAVRAVDGRDRPTALLERFLERLDAREPQDLVERIYDSGMTRGRIASMADLVFDLAGSDCVAGRIVEKGAGALADSVAAVARQLEFSPSSYPLVFGGTVVLKQESYRRLILSRLALTGLSPASVTTVDEPVWGAVAIARSMCAR